ncbi:asparagine synthase (glutamine-hydrolyzing), partial [bacterium]|nr:asparagine synthase (glutamine-hydrolyzing) [bacterium]
MCGICGTIGFESFEYTRRMMDVMVHRGPDEEGHFIDDNRKISLGIRRLSIIDTKTGSQPLFNEDKSIILVINGEIYNFRDIRNELLNKGHVFNTRSDGEVLVHLYEECGIDSINYIRGMFAFCLFDKKEDVIYLSKDRFGMKPLYFSYVGENLIFASEIKALLASGLIESRINPKALDLYLSFPAVPAPLTIIDGIEALLPAHFMEIKKNKLRKVEYWKLEDHLPTIESPKRINLNEQTEMLRVLLESSVKEHMVSDVPLGSFLSGGIDSSAISYFASKFSGRKLNTFSIGYDIEKTGQKEFDELSQASYAARCLDTNHHELIVSSDDLFNDMPKIIHAMDQPTGNGINSYYVSKAAKEKVTVSLSGTGGDELFGGYPWFIGIMKYYNFVRRWQAIPVFLKKPVSRLLSTIQPARNLTGMLAEKEEPPFDKAYRGNRWVIHEKFKDKLYNP